MSNIKLSPAIKHLLTLRNPNALPSPPLTQLNRVFAKTLQDAKIKKVETGWLVATVRRTKPRPAFISFIIVDWFTYIDLHIADSQSSYSCRTLVPFRHEVDTWWQWNTKWYRNWYPSCGEQSGTNARISVEKRHLHRCTASEPDKVLSGFSSAWYGVFMFYIF